MIKKLSEYLTKKMFWKNTEVTLYMPDSVDCYVAYPFLPKEYHNVIEAEFSFDILVFDEACWNKLNKSFKHNTVVVLTNNANNLVRPANYTFTSLEQLHSVYLYNAKLLGRPISFILSNEWLDNTLLKISSLTLIANTNDTIKTHSVLARRRGILLDQELLKTLFKYSHTEERNYVNRTENVSFYKRKFFVNSKPTYKKYNKQKKFCYSKFYIKNMFIQ